MNIAFDAKRAFQNRSGLGNYSRNLIQSAISFHPEHHYHLFSPTDESDLFNPKGVQVISKKGGLSWFWRSFGITGKLISEKIELYHGISNELPLNISRYRGKKVVTIHDVLFKRFPGYYSAIDRYIYDFKTSKACKEADTVVCISEETKKDLLRFYDVNESKIEIVHQQVSAEFFTREESAEVIESYELDERYILYVGTVEERKDLITLLKAFKDLKDQELLLYVVGGKRNAYFKKVLTYIIENDLYERVVFFEKVPSTVLPMIYRNAFAVVYPSLFEGWGLPVAEGICSHVPVVSTRNTSMQEAGGDACLYFDAGNHNELHDILDQFLRSDLVRQQLINKTYSRSRYFDPQTCSDRMNAVYLK